MYDCSNKLRCRGMSDESIFTSHCIESLWEIHCTCTSVANKMENTFLAAEEHYAHFDQCGRSLFIYLLFIVLKNVLFVFYYNYYCFVF